MGESVRTVKVGNNSVKIYRREAEQYQQKALLMWDYCGGAYGSRTQFHHFMKLRDFDGNLAAISVLSARGEIRQFARFGSGQGPGETPQSLQNTAQVVQRT
jgi:hypothetical protein